MQISDAITRSTVTISNAVVTATTTTTTTATTTATTPSAAFFSVLSQNEGGTDKLFPLE